MDKTAVLDLFNDDEIKKRKYGNGAFIYEIDKNIFAVKHEVYLLIFYIKKNEKKLVLRKKIMPPNWFFLDIYRN